LEFLGLKHELINYIIKVKFRKERGWGENSSLKRRRYCYVRVFGEENRRK
jgi:hypothetical protein